LSRSVNGIKEIKHKEEIFKKLKKIEPNKVYLVPLKYENQWYDYVFGSINGKIFLRIFTEPNRVEESSKAFVELIKLQEKENK